MKVSSHDKKAYVIMFVAAVLSLANVVVAFAIGAWVAPAIPLSVVFIINQFIFLVMFIIGIAYWLDGP